MLGKLRNFSKSKLAIILVAIIIVPFVFWGIGSVFSGEIQIMLQKSITKIYQHKTLLNLLIILELTQMN